MDDSGNLFFFQWVSGIFPMGRWTFRLEWNGDLSVFLFPICSNFLNHFRTNFHILPPSLLSAENGFGCVFVCESPRLPVRVGLFYWRGVDLYIHRNKIDRIRCHGRLWKNLQWKNAQFCQPFWDMNNGAMFVERSAECLY